MVKKQFGYYKADPFYYGNLKESAKRMRMFPTDAESMLWNYLRGKQLGLRFRRQFPVYEYIADFICLPLRLIVEVDGSIHQETPQMEHDQLRTNFLESKGFHVMRVQNEDVLNNIEQVIHQIKTTMNDLQNANAATNATAAGEPLLRRGRGRLLMIGAGGVATVCAFKIVQNQGVFSEFMIASHHKEKCDRLVDAIHAKGYNMDIKTAEVDADDVEQLKELFSSYQPELVVNLALPYQDLTIMEACLACGCNYLDTANYEPKDEAHFEYSWQWAYKQRFEDAGLTAILGCGFDPGVSQAYTAYAAKHHFDEIHYLDIVDCNAGNHHKAFATNFNPEINIREITQKGLYYENGEWIETEPLAVHQDITYPNVGPRDSYLMHHEELESLVKNYPTIKRARFWMTFGQQYLTYLDCIQNLGMSRIDNVEFEAPLADGSGKTVKVNIVPLQFLKAVLPNPQDLGENYDGETSIGCRIRGIKDGKERTYYIYNNCKHQDAYNETGMQGVSYTTGVPAMAGAMMFFKGLWKKPGVWNVEDFDPDPFLQVLNEQGLPWHEEFDKDLEL